MSDDKALVLADDDAISLLRRQLAGEDLTDDEFEVFLRVARERQLDPFRGQIMAQKRKGRLSIVTRIDGYRLIAERNVTYEGQTKPEWTRDGRTWADVWIWEHPPLAARVGVHRKGFREPIYGTATRAEYLQTNRHGDPASWWAKNGGAHMLAKCAEALAIRKAFPDDVSGLYTKEEMAQAQIEDDDTTVPLVRHTVEEPTSSGLDIVIEAMSREEVIAEMTLHAARIGRDRCRELVPTKPTELKDAKMALSILREEPTPEKPESPPESHNRTCTLCSIPLPARRHDPICETCTINRAQQQNAEQAAEVYVPDRDDEPAPPTDEDLQSTAETPWEHADKLDAGVPEMEEAARASRADAQQARGQKSREVAARNALAAEAEQREQAQQGMEFVGPKEPEGPQDEQKPWEKYPAPERSA